MVGELLLRLYHSYSLILGVTSYFRVSQSYRETWLTRGYVLVVNVLTLSLLPLAFWLSAQYVRATGWFPNLLTYTTYILFTVSYVTIVYTLITRSCRDTALLKVHGIVQRLKRAPDFVVEHSVDGTLDNLYNLKLGSVLIICLFGMSTCLMIPNEKRFSVMLCAFFYLNAMNIPLIAVHRYFLALWDIACCYQSLNKELSQLLDSLIKDSPSRLQLEQLEQLQHLWMLHSLLGRCTLRLNKIHELLMLAARFENLAFFAINGYWGILFSSNVNSPFYVILYGAMNYYVHIMDYYLLNFMFDQTIRYQSAIQHSLSEVPWSREVHIHILYIS